MKVKLAGALSILLVVTFAVSLLGQSRNPRNRGPRDAPSQTRGTTTPAPAPESATPPNENGSSSQGAGKDNPPRQGYVPLPEPPQPGTYIGFVIPADPLDRAYWELYDRGRPVTLTGKVTRVDWTTPNSYIYIAAEGGLWAVESDFVQFRQSSVTPAIKEEQTITVMGYLPKDPAAAELPARRFPPIAAYLRISHLIRASEITTVFGQKLRLGRPPSDAEMAERLKCSPLGC